MTQKINWGEFVREAGVYAVRLSFASFVAAMAMAVFLLGETFAQPVPMRVLVAAGCAVGIFGHGVAATATKNGTNAGRMMHGVALGAWLLLSLFLASLYALTSSERLARFVPDGMADIGAMVYALCFGIGLFTSTLALVVPAVAARPIHDTQTPTLGSAIARFGEPLFIILCIGASSLHLFEFGMSVAKVGMFSTVAAMVIADLSFLVAEKRVLHEMKARHAAGRYDRFDLVAWGVFGLLVLCYLVLVNVYSVRHTAGTLDAGDPLLRNVIDFYGASPTLLILSMAALALVTAFVDMRSGAGVIEGEARPILSRLADTVKTQREALRELRDAVTEPPPAQIAGPQKSQMAKDNRDTGHAQIVTKTERPPKDRTMKTRRCRWCKTPFTATDGRALYCSAKCRKAASRAVNVSQREDHE
ncbi:MAG: hypothetical protein ACFLMY_05005 [Candidatus Brachytrichaceae bacterium NZ_4S206]